MSGIKVRLFLVLLGILLHYVIHRAKHEQLELLKAGLLKNDALQTHFESNVDPINSESPYILSYSLFGENWDRYGSAVETLARSAAQSSFYKNWSIRLYHDGKMINNDLEIALKEKYANLFLYNVGFLPQYGNVSYINGMVWRFLATGDPNLEVVCSRDLDSLILKREEDAVREWLKSGKIFHVMRDHPAHGVHILGGTWCFRNSKNPSLGVELAKIFIQKSKQRSSSEEAPYGDGQNVLGEYVWPLIENDVLQHDAYLCTLFQGSVPFPSKRNEDGQYVGMVGNIPKNEIIIPTCPLECRPENHQDWEYC